MAKKTRGKVSYWFVVYDEENRLYNVLGPVIDDTDLTKRVAHLRDRGGKVRCSTSPAESATREEKMAGIGLPGWKYTADSILDRLDQTLPAAKN